MSNQDLISGDLTVLAVGERSLPELAAIIRRENDLAGEALCDAIQHVINAGCALLQARQLQPKGEWMPWIEENSGLSFGRAAAYMRIAEHRDVVLAEGVTSMSQAEHLLRQRGLQRRSKVDQSKLNQAIELEKRGLNLRETADLLGVTEVTVWRWRNPQAAKALRQKERQRAKARQIAERGRQNEAAVRRVGGGISEGYALLRKALLALDRAESEESGEVREALQKATVALYRAEDAIVRASKLK